MAAAVAMVWKWIYNEKMGILTVRSVPWVEKVIGWLTDPNSISMVYDMIVGLWMSVGYTMIILLAGMQESKSYYEAGDN